MVVNSLRNSELNPLHPLEPSIKADNAHTKVSVSPNEYYMYDNDVIQYKNCGWYVSGDLVANAEVLWNVTQQCMSIVNIDLLRPLTVAEKILFVNE